MGARTVERTSLATSSQYYIPEPASGELLTVYRKFRDLGINGTAEHLKISADVEGKKQSGCRTTKLCPLPRDSEPSSF